MTPEHLSYGEEEVSPQIEDWRQKPFGKNASVRHPWRHRLEANNESQADQIEKFLALVLIVVDLVIEGRFVFRPALDRP